MAKLSEVAPVARKSIKYGSLGIVSLIVLRLLWNVGYSWWRARNPEPPPPPDTKFGKMPKIEFPDIDQSSLTYILETRTGGFPKLKDQFRVYFMPIRKPNLLAYDEAELLANRLGFIQEPKKLSERNYRWNSSSPIPSSFTIDVITGRFVLDKKWESDESYETPTLLISKQRAVDLAQNWVSRYGLLEEDLRKGSSKTQPVKIKGEELVSAISLSKAQFIKVDLFRSMIDGYEVVTPFDDRGLVTFVIAFQRTSDMQFVNVDYNYFPIDKDQSATYPLITPDTAWKRLQEGSGFIASVKDGVKEVKIREIYIAYYDADSPQQFMQPVYVFEGDSGFVGYVPAVADEWVE